MAKKKNQALLHPLAQAGVALQDLSPNTTNALSNIRDKFRPSSLRYASGMHIGEQTKYVSWSVDPASVGADGFDQLELLQVTDVHWGTIGCRYHRVIEYRDWILSDPRRYMVWTGDMIDSKIAGISPGSNFDSLLDPSGQVYSFCEAWAPVRHRILGYVAGNHERRGVRYTGNLGRLIATLLEIPYSDGQQNIDLFYGKHKPFKIHAWHGSGSGQTKGSIAQLIDKQMRLSDAQLFFVGHLHQCMTVGDWLPARDPVKCNVHLIKRMGIMSSSFQSYFGGYPEEAGMRVSDVMMSRAILFPDGKWEVTTR